MNMRIGHSPDLGVQLHLSEHYYPLYLEKKENPKEDRMHWLSFLIGALVGWLISWLIDYLICRPRRTAAEALLNAKLENCNKESTALKTQLAT